MDPVGGNTRLTSAFGNASAESITDAYTAPDAPRDGRIAAAGVAASAAATAPVTGGGVLATDVRLEVKVAAALVLAVASDGGLRAS